MSDRDSEAAGLRVRRERLGLSASELAALLGVSPVTIRRYEAPGSAQTPGGDFLERFETLEDYFDREVDKLSATVAREPSHEVRVFSSGSDLHQADPFAHFPASWGRMVAANVLRRQPNARVTY